MAKSPRSSLQRAVWGGTMGLKIKSECLDGNLCPAKITRSLATLSLSSRTVRHPFNRQSDIPLAMGWRTMLIATEAHFGAVLR